MGPVESAGDRAAQEERTREAFALAMPGISPAALAAIATGLERQREQFRQIAALVDRSPTLQLARQIGRFYAPLPGLAETVSQARIQEGLRAVTGIPSQAALLAGLRSIIGPELDTRRQLAEWLQAQQVPREVAPLPMAEPGPVEIHVHLHLHVTEAPGEPE